MHNNAITLTTAFWKNSNKKETLPYRMYGILTSEKLKYKKKMYIFRIGKMWYTLQDTILNMKTSQLKMMKM